MGVTFVLFMSTLGSVVGVKCRAFTDNTIKWTLDCSAMNLSTSPPPTALHPVVLLNMSHNELTVLSEYQFVNWTDITHIDLSFNKIQIISKKSFDGLNNLNELNLKNNWIEVLSSNISHSLPRLKILNLSSNRLKFVNTDAFNYIPSLMKINIGNNPDIGKRRENLEMMQLALSPSLLSLDISNISLKNISADFLTNATHLISLNVGNNPLNVLPTLLPTLRNLNLSGTAFEIIHPDLFVNAFALRRLTMENMIVLKTIDKNAFSGLINIEELIIKNCPKLSSISKDVFRESFPKLQIVVFSNCALSTLPKTFETILRNVKRIDLQGNPWHCDGRIAWMADLNILPNYTTNLRCSEPADGRGMTVQDYYKPRSLHPYSSLLMAGLVVALVAILVTSVVTMIRRSAKLKARTYRQLDIRLQERNVSSLPPL